MNMNAFMNKLNKEKIDPDVLEAGMQEEQQMLFEQQVNKYATILLGNKECVKTKKINEFIGKTHDVLQKIFIYQPAET